MRHSVHPPLGSARHLYSIVHLNCVCTTFNLRLGYTLSAVEALIRSSKSFGTALLARRDGRFSAESGQSESFRRGELLGQWLASGAPPVAIAYGHRVRPTELRTLQPANFPNKLRPNKAAKGRHSLPNGLPVHAAIIEFCDLMQLVRLHQLDYLHSRLFTTLSSGRYSNSPYRPRYMSGEQIRGDDRFFQT